jgi:two-component system NarL family sensor kinase
MRRRGKPVSVTRAVVQFGLSSVVAVILIGFAGIAVLKSEGHREAFSDAKELTTLAGRGIAQPLVTDALIAGNPAARARLDRLVRASILGEGIARVKIWTPQGRIVYSDASALIGSVYPLSAEELSSLKSGRIVAEPSSDRSLPENRFERGLAPLVDIYLPIHTATGRMLLFEGYLPSHEVSASARHLWEAFAPALFGGLILLALVQLPLAWSLASRLRRGQQERESLLEHAIEASEEERRRIAGDLHDGVVQDLAGVAYSVAAAAETEEARRSRALADSLRSSAAQTRQSIRSLRSLLVEIYPANLHSTGLHAALSDLVSSLAGRGIEARIEFPEAFELSDEAESLLYRVAQEAIRNVSAHSQAEHVELIVRASPVSLAVRDDGVGFSEQTISERASEGHMGLRLLSSLAEEQGASLEIESEPGRGTVVRVVVPAP